MSPAQAKAYWMLVPKPIRFTLWMLAAPAMAFVVMMLAAVLTLGLVAALPFLAAYEAWKEFK